MLHEREDSAGASDTIESVWRPQDVPSSSKSDPLAAAMSARSARSGRPVHGNGPPPHVTRDILMKDVSSSQPFVRPETRAPPEEARHVDDEVVEVVDVPAVTHTTTTIPAQQAISARYGGVDATHACTANCCPDPTATVSPSPTAGECHTWNHQADRCDAQPGCVWRGSSRDDRDGSNALSALAVFVLILILVVVGALVVRWSPTPSLYRLDVYETKSASA